MLFNSSVFITRFLPVALIGFFALGACGWRKPAVIWLTLASLFFYGWWNVTYLPLLLGSMAFNYAVGRALTRHRRKWLLVMGVAANLALLGYCKYAGFFVVTVNSVLSTAWLVPDIALPLAISFFTFQQIAFLSDSYDGVAEESDFANYSMFITFFPHLIAGPITHHREMLPQFADRRIFRPQMDKIALGVTLFVLGLCKKVILADTVALWVRPVFAASSVGDPLTVLEAWGGSVGYALQIYFDFSGYTDMAIGLGLLFGIRLPRNFDSPYKARNIIDFWSRWHMTLTRFLTAYIYNPITLTLNRARIQAGKPVLRRGKTTPGAFAMLVAMPTIVTMFLAGLWHGAGWTFIVFGTLHGVYLTVNHAWRFLKARWKWPADRDNPIIHAACVLLTFVCVIVGLVFFRAPDMRTAFRLLADMGGAHGLVLPYEFDRLPGVWNVAHLVHLRFGSADLLNLPETGFLIFLLAIVWGLPNTHQWLRDFETSLGPAIAPTGIEQRVSFLRRLFVWRPSWVFGVMVGCVGFLALTRALSAAPSEFLYFKF